MVAENKDLSYYIPKDKRGALPLRQRVVSAVSERFNSVVRSAEWLNQASQILLPPDSSRHRLVRTKAFFSSQKDKPILMRARGDSYVSYSDPTEIDEYGNEIPLERYGAVHEVATGLETILERPVYFDDASDGGAILEKTWMHLQDISFPNEADGLLWISSGGNTHFNNLIRDQEIMGNFDRYRETGDFEELRPLPPIIMEDLGEVVNNSILLVDSTEDMPGNENLQHLVFSLLPDASTIEIPDAGLKNASEQQRVQTVNTVQKYDKVAQFFLNRFSRLSNWARLTAFQAYINTYKDMYGKPMSFSLHCINPANVLPHREQYYREHPKREAYKIMGNHFLNRSYKQGERKSIGALLQARAAA